MLYGIHIPDTGNLVISGSQQATPSLSLYTRTSLCANFRPMMRLVIMLLVISVTACNTAATRDIASPEYKIPVGSKITLHKDLKIPAGESHVVLQDGTPGSAANEYKANCRFIIKQLGPSAIQPAIFTVRETSSQRDWGDQPDIMRFYREFRLESDKQQGITRFVCQKWDGPMMGKPVTVPEMRDAVGDYISFEFSQ